MARLGDTTLTGCSSIPDFIPTGTKTMFAQASAPTSWTRVTDDTANNRMLRVINGSGGGGTGGSSDPTLNNVVPSHTHSFETGTVSSDHAHTGVTDVAGGHNHTTARGDVAVNDNARGVYGKGSGGGGLGGIGEDRFLINDVGNHNHNFATSGITANHIHYGSTDNGSSQTNWSPRYINIILCSKN